MRILLAVALLAIAACDPKLPPATPSAPPTWEGQPAYPDAPAGGGNLIGRGCCLVHVACTDPDAQGVRWADLSRRVPCWSDCGRDVDDYQRQGSWLRDVTSPAETLDGIAYDQVCAP